MKTLHNIQSEPILDSKLAAVKWWFEQRSHIYKIRIRNGRLEYFQKGLRLTNWVDSQHDQLGWRGVWTEYERLRKQKT